MHILLLAVGAALVNNVILSQFLGLCPFLGVSKSVNTATGMGGAVIFVMTIAGIRLSEYNRVHPCNSGTGTVCRDVLKEEYEVFIRVTWSIPSPDHNKLCSSWYRTFKCTE